jgi:hypothetical protein
MELKLNLNLNEQKDLMGYCDLNKLDPNETIKKCYLNGFMIEKYGLLGASGEVIEKIVEKEVIKYVEVPKEVIKEVVRTEYIEVPKEVEKIVEIIKEIPSPPKEVKVIEYVDREVVKEVFVTNLDNFCDKNHYEELLQKIKELENRPPEIKEIIVEKIINTDNKTKLDALQSTIQKLRQETLEKDKIISEYEKTIKDIEQFQENKKAFFLNGSNLDDKLYK